MAAFFILLRESKTKQINFSTQWIFLQLLLDRQIQFSFINGNYYVNKKKMKRVYNFITTMAELAVIITNWLELFRNSKMIITICDDLLILSECANQFFLNMSRNSWIIFAHFSKRILPAVFKSGFYQPESK